MTGAVGLVLAATAACGGPSGGDGSTTSASGPSPIAPTHAARPVPSAIKDVPDLHKTVVETGCAKASDGWSISGTAMNPGTSTKTYKILAFFNDKYSRTIDYARTTVRVAGGQTENWTATAKYDAPDGTQCVLRAVTVR